jgi:hypothetical protein
MRSLYESFFEERILLLIDGGFKEVRLRASQYRRMLVLRIRVVRFDASVLVEFRFRLLRHLEVSFEKPCDTRRRHVLL